MSPNPLDTVERFIDSVDSLHRRIATSTRDSGDLDDDFASEIDKLKDGLSRIQRARSYLNDTERKRIDSYIQTIRRRCYGRLENVRDEIDELEERDRLHQERDARLARKRSERETYRRSREQEDEDLDG